MWLRLGSEIKRIRKTKNLTQKKLAEDLCHQSEISRIEGGKAYPGIDILSGISKKLQIPLIYWFEFIFSEDRRIQKEMKAKLDDLSRKKEYPLILKITKEELQNSNISEEFRQYISWQYYVAAFELNIMSFTDFYNGIKKLLNMSVTGSEIYQEFSILNSLAIACINNDRIEESIEYYQQILSNDYVEEDLQTFIKVSYNYSKLLYSRMQYHKALELINKSINLSIKMNSMYLLGQLYYQRGLIKEKMGDTTEAIAEDIEKALFFFKMQNLDLYVGILYKNKSEYLRSLSK
jgi:HTH-type transcriptional regulator, pleiotropic regulator of extracellular virulence genes